MILTHSLPGRASKKNVPENVQGFLSNKRGSYLLLSQQPISRYAGWFWFDGVQKRMFKIIEQIRQKDAKKCSELKNNFYSLERKSPAGSEEFFLPPLSSSLCYSLSKKGTVEVILDVKESYDNRVWGRNYEVWEENGTIVIRFEKKTDSREDGSHGQHEYSIFITIKGHEKWEKKMEWEEHQYPQDAERNSPPASRYAVKAIEMEGSSFVVSVSHSKEEAIKESEKILKAKKRLVEKEKSTLLRLVKEKKVKSVATSSLPSESKVAFFSALNALDKLSYHDHHAPGIFAGLPWFFQFWSRDALISIKALQLVHPTLAKEIIAGYADATTPQGMLPNISQSAQGNADGIGWLFHRLHEFPIKGKDFQNKTTMMVESLLNGKTKDGLATNEAKETWMDTQWNDDGRRGSRIEMQALRLSLYRTAHEITKNGKYKVREEQLKAETKKRFWNGKWLKDASDDGTVRPNIFIAAYLYPELLSTEEWETCFTSALKALWLPWGGLSTIDKSNPLFTADHTGEDIKSYHRGDSWFWINNMAAVVVARTNKEKFKPYIEKILAASTKEILWQGAAGCHAELSSASRLKSQGCLNQAWSNAMFVELGVELSK